MASRRVFVVWSNQLFCESLRLLLNHPHIEWVGATSDYASAPAQIASLEPDTILVEEVDRSPQAMALLKTSPDGVHFISLRLSDNELDIYHRQQRTVLQAEEFLRLILNL